jgi:glycosyltransferase involved in cell wall biosynthesis
MLAARGHRATQWASTFDHFRKKQRSKGDCSVMVEPGYQVELLAARPYRRHVGLARIRSQQDVARRFSQRATERETPDMILVSLPTLELARAVLDFAEPRRIPVIVDIRDLWPDVYLTAVPRWARRFVRPLCTIFEQQAQSICRRASFLTGVSEQYLGWGVAKAGRERRRMERSFYLAYPRRILSREQSVAVGDKLSAAGIKPDRGLRCCFFGTLGRSAGINAIVQLARSLREKGHVDIEFVVCGRGPREQEFRAAIRDLPQVRYLGWLNAEEITGLMDRSDIGLAVYEGGVLQSVPNKPVEYLAGGLSVLTTLDGELSRLLREHQCGESFESNEIEAMQEWLIDRRQNRELLASERRQANALYLKEFEANQVYGQMIDWMETLASAKRSTVAA